MDKNIEELIEKGKMIDSVYAKFANVVVVRPYMNNITGGFLSSAIFERILFFSRKYKEIWIFATPSKDKDYQEGKSWCEVFNVSLLQFNTALKKFAFKLGKTKNKINKEEALVIYYRGRDNKTYYSVNWEVYHRKLAEIDDKVLNYLVNKETAITKVNKETAITKGNDDPLITNNNESLKKSKKESNNNNENSSLTNIKENIFKSVKFNYKTRKWNNVTEEYRAELEVWFPDLDLDEEFKDMRDWLIDHANKPKESFRIFITKWLKNSQKNPNISMEESLRKMEEEDKYKHLEETYEV